MADMADLHALIEPVVIDAGFELVRVALLPEPKLTLQIMVEDPATGQMHVDDCARLSRKISVLLDEADPIPAQYMLEISSPGIDRPLTRPKDYQRWAGHVARIEMRDAIEVNGASRRRFQGYLVGLDGDDVVVAVDGLGETRLALSGVARAKLVLTDALIAATTPLATEGTEEEIDEDDGDDGDWQPAAGSSGMHN